MIAYFVQDLGWYSGFEERSCVWPFSGFGVRSCLLPTNAFDCDKYANRLSVQRIPARLLLAQANE